MKKPTPPLTRTLTDDEFQSLIIYSERYTIGRASYAVQDICDIIRKYIKELNNNTLGVLIRDIESPAFGNYGWQIDKDNWLHTLEVLKAERELRKAENPDKPFFNPPQPKEPQ